MIMIMIIIFRTVHASISDSSGKEIINSVKLKSKITGRTIQHPNPV